MAGLLSFPVPLPPGFYARHFVEEVKMVLTLLFGLAWVVTIIISRGKLAAGVEAFVMGTREDWSRWRNAQSSVSAIQLPDDPAELEGGGYQPEIGTLATQSSDTPWQSLLFAFHLSVIGFVLSCVGLLASLVYEKGGYIFPYTQSGLSWLIVVPLLCILHIILIVKIIMFAIGARRGLSSTVADSHLHTLGTNALTIGSILFAAPLGTYFISLPAQHPFLGGWFMDLFVALILPVIGLSVSIWGVIMGERYGQNIRFVSEQTSVPT
ncbi:hypothetical protein BKA62DRAFT_692142 [Auriculariales sp. MPI-PUGE-AT-0066]|nr:hypothetical protein BKA62DRAFT_692142 [Auriculariales sp. MPI-PUGE-AT-0066]